MVFGVSLGVLSLSPFDANTPPSDPVKKMASVLSKSMKAASFGA